MKIFWVDGKPCIASGNGFTELLPTELFELDEAGEITGSEDVYHD